MAASERYLARKTQSLSSYNTALIRAARDNNLDGVRKVIEDAKRAGLNVGAITNAANSKALSEAAFHDNYEMVRLLIRNHATPTADCISKCSFTQKGKKINNLFSRMLNLVTPHPSEESSVRSGSTTRSGFIKRARKLTSTEANIRLIRAARESDIKEMEIVLRHAKSSEIDINDLVNAANSEALDLAIKRDNLPMVKRLLEEGATPSAACYRHCSSSPYQDLLLSLLRDKDGVAIVKFKESAIDPVTRKMRTRTARRAVHTAPDEFYSLVCSTEADSIRQLGEMLDTYSVNAQKIDSGWGTLHHATRFSDLDKIRFLLAKGANVNAQDVNGWTPLHLAVDMGDRDRARLLLRHGAKASLGDKNGWTPLHLATSKHDLPILREVIASKKSRVLRTQLVDTTDKNGWTASHIATLGRPDYSPEVHRTLLMSGAAVSKKTTGKYKTDCFALAGKDAAKSSVLKKAEQKRRRRTRARMRPRSAALKP